MSPILRGRRSRLRSQLVLTALAAAAVVAAGLVVAKGATAAGPLNYVAMGDSYSSVGTLTSLAHGSPPECGRDTDSYPFVVARALAASLTDVACGGAVSASLTGSQYPGVPPQLAALSPSTSVVTITIGGNDNSKDPSDPNSADGFLAQFVLKCGAVDLAHLWTGTPCKKMYQAQLQTLLAAEKPIIAADFSEIEDAAPNAAVFVIGYADILPQKGACFPTIPLSAGDTAFMNGIEVQINLLAAAAAAAHHATFVDAYALSIGHDACQPESNRWVEPLLPGTDAAPIHPNATGQRAIGTFIAATIAAQLDH
jgi:lysophospholipase L1-like esterase